MVQVLPQVQVFQEFTLVPTPVTLPLRAFIFGPHYNVRSYEKAKADISLGAYDSTTDTVYSWPGRLAGEVVDQAFTRLFVDDAWIRYFNYAGATAAVASIAGSTLRLAADGWAAVTGFPRSALVPRDVAVGDAVKITDPADATSTLSAVVRSLARIPVASTHAAAGTVGPANAGSTSAGVVEISAPAGSFFTPTLTTTLYKPYKVGVTGDRYTFTITTAGVSGVARMSVVSDSGLDDDYDVVITTATPVAVGDLGLTVTFADAGGPHSYVLGATWVEDVLCAFAAPAGSVITASGTYTGLTSSNYILQITEGGIVGTDTPKFTVRLADGSDAGGPYNATAAAVAVGNYGISIAWTAATKLCKGDVFTVAVVAASEGRVRDIVLDKTIPTALVLSDIKVEISAVRDQEILVPRYGTPLVANWTQAAAAITVKSGILSYTTETGLSGYPIVAGTLYSSYRALAQTYADDIHTVSDVSELAALFSDLTPENPLGYGLKKALENANGTDVKYIGVATNDLAGFSTAVSKTLEREDCYSFAPITKDASILSMVAGHVDAQSTPEKGRWRIAWVTDAVSTLLRIVGSDVTPFLGAITHDSADPAGTYRLVTCSTATFLDSGVVAGDAYRYAYATDSVGAVTYATDIVDTIVSQTQLKILTGPASPVVVAEKFEIWRTLSATEQVAEVIAGNTYADRRVYNVIGGNQNEADGFTDVDDMFLAAAYAGLRSGVAPHQGLTNVALTGFTAIPWIMESLTATERDALMSGGLWVVQQATDGTGTIFCRKQVSTDVTDLNTTEQSVTTNVDSISYYLKATLAPYIGRTNNVAGVQTLIRGDIEAVFQYFFNNKTPTLGSQILEGTDILELRPHAVLPDNLVIKIQLVIPYPLNVINVYLVI